MYSYAVRVLESCPHIDGHSVSARRLESLRDFNDLGILFRHSQNRTIRPSILRVTMNHERHFILRLEMRF